MSNSSAREHLDRTAGSFHENLISWIALSLILGASVSNSSFKGYRRKLLFSLIISTLLRFTSVPSFFRGCKHESNIQNFSCTAIPSNKINITRTVAFKKTLRGPKTNIRQAIFV
jgi:hypothetical protein